RPPVATRIPLVSSRNASRIVRPLRSPQQHLCGDPRSLAASVSTPWIPSSAVLSSSTMTVSREWSPCPTPIANDLDSRLCRRNSSMSSSSSRSPSRNEWHCNLALAMSSSAMTLAACLNEV
ncbi:unnamed protein product, partial [Ixodes pacificus]